MTNLLPPIGATVHLHGGTITRTAEATFQAKRVSGRIWTTNPQVHLPIVAFISAVNTLLRDAGQPTFVLPCSRCGDYERLNPHETYCCRACRRLACGLPERTETRGGKEKLPTAYDFAPLRALLGLPPDAGAPEQAPLAQTSLGEYRRALDKRLFGRVMNGYLRPGNWI